MKDLRLFQQALEAVGKSKTNKVLYVTKKTKPLYISRDIYGVDGNVNVVLDDMPDSAGIKISQLNNYVIIFKDEEGNILSKKEYVEGSTLEEPSVPEKSGYKFIGWDNNFSGQATAPITYTAQYEELPSIKIIMNDTYTDCNAVPMNVAKTSTVSGDPIFELTNIDEDYYEIVENAIIFKQHYDGLIKITVKAIDKYGDYQTDSKTIRVNCEVADEVYSTISNVAPITVDGTSTSAIINYTCAVTTTNHNGDSNTVHTDHSKQVTFAANTSYNDNIISSSFVCEHGDIVNWTVTQLGVPQVSKYTVSNSATVNTVSSFGGNVNIYYDCISETMTNTGTTTKTDIAKCYKTISISRNNSFSTISRSGSFVDPNGYGNVNYIIYQYGLSENQVIYYTTTNNVRVNTNDFSYNGKFVYSESGAITFFYPGKLNSSTIKTIKLPNTATSSVSFSGFSGTNLDKVTLPGNIISFTGNFTGLKSSCVVDLTGSSTSLLNNSNFRSTFAGHTIYINGNYYGVLPGGTISSGSGMSGSGMSSSGMYEDVSDPDIIVELEYTSLLIDQGESTTGHARLDMHPWRRPITGADWYIYDSGYVYDMVPYDSTKVNKLYSAVTINDAPVCINNNYYSFNSGKSVIKYKMLDNTRLVTDQFTGFDALNVTKIYLPNTITEFVEGVFWPVNIGTSLSKCPLRKQANITIIYDGTINQWKSIKNSNKFIAKPIVYSQAIYTKVTLQCTDGTLTLL